MKEINFVNLYTYLLKMLKEHAVFWYYLLIASLIILGIAIFIITDPEMKTFISPIKAETLNDRFWDVQSIDAMKYSRDVARQKLNDPSYDQEIEAEVSEIAKTGATHIGIGVPYDNEFVPFLKRWVESARKHNLNVWFRGNFSGWEGWFGYKKIDRIEHSKLLVEFIEKNPYLFEDGDIFTSCPECENGGPGDPRNNNDAKGHVEFLIYEHNLTTRLFKKLGKNIKTNYYSMNGDVAKLIMDRETTKALDGVITIDHYVKTSKQLVTDAHNFASNGDGSVILGEWGAPIPDIHGDLSEKQQAEWIDNSLKNIISEPSITGINYWVNKGGSTALWNDDNSRRAAVAVLTKYFKPTRVKGTLTDEFGEPVDDVHIQTKYQSLMASGEYSVPIIEKDTIVFSKTGYSQIEVPINAAQAKVNRNIIITKTKRSTFERIKFNIQNIFDQIQASFNK